jgi:hypothetical protein
VDTNVRVRIVPDTDYDPSDLDLPADELAEHVWLLSIGEWSAVGAIAERQCPRCRGWNPAGGLWGIEIAADDGYGPGDVITPADIPLGPADPRRLYGYPDLAAVPPNLAVPATAAESYLIHIAADLLSDAAADAQPC